MPVNPDWQYYFSGQVNRLTQNDARNGLVASIVDQIEAWGIESTLNGGGPAIDVDDDAPGGWGVSYVSPGVFDVTVPDVSAYTQLQTTIGVRDPHPGFGFTGAVYSRPKAEHTLYGVISDVVISEDPADWFSNELIIAQPVPGAGYLPSSDTSNLTYFWNGANWQAKTVWAILRNTALSSPGGWGKARVTAVGLPAGISLIYTETLPAITRVFNRLRGEAYGGALSASENSMGLVVRVDAGVSPGEYTFLLVATPDTQLADIGFGYQDYVTSPPAWINDGDTLSVRLIIYPEGMAPEDIPEPGSPDPPGIPGGLSPTEICSLFGDSVTLSWEPVVGATGYEVRRVDTGTIIYSGSATGATISGLTPGVEYSFEIRATNDAGNSGWSEAITAMPTAAPTDAPVLTGVVTHCGTKHVLEWPPVI